MEIAVYGRFLLFVYSVGCFIHCSAKAYRPTATDLSSVKSEEAIVEVACTVYTVLDSCSSYIDSCAGPCKRFGEKCIQASVGSRYYSVVCNNQTLSSILAFLRDGERVHENVTWENLGENPTQIVNYVISNAFRGKLFRKMTSQIRHAIPWMTSDGRTFREGPRGRSKHFVNLATRIDLLCLLFTVTKSCSSQLDCENSANCQKISLICYGLSSYSRYLTHICHVDVIYEMMELVGSVDKRENLKDVQLFWGAMFDSPALFMQRVADAINSGNTIYSSHHIFSLFILYVFLYV